MEFEEFDFILYEVRKQENLFVFFVLFSLQDCVFIQKVNFVIINNLSEKVFKICFLGDLRFCKLIINLNYYIYFIDYKVNVWNLDVWNIFQGL